ncbi:MAG TPA: hypothetical protein VKC15_20190 [Gemmatimonadales bacterium]|nr:hypothetical protein [Gemmatimonadales bacterium]
MRIIGIENMSPEQLKGEVAAGGRFVIYQYCISVVVVSFKRGSDIYFIRAEDNAVTKGLLFTLCSLVLGWWGIPWGPIWTIATIVTNLRGGRNVTAEVLRSLATPVPGGTPK